jgi:hypothetical protein
LTLAVWEAGNQNNEMKLTVSFYPQAFSGLSGLLMSSLLFRPKFTARCARDRRARRDKIRKGMQGHNKDMVFLCALSELCGEYII